MRHPAKIMEAKKMTEKLQGLFVERERKRLAAKTFLDEHTDSAGKISVEDSIIAEKFITEMEEISMQIENELNKPTGNPILAQPYNPFEPVKNYSKFGVSGAEYRKNFFDALRTGCQLSRKPVATRRIFTAAGNARRTYYSVDARKRIAPNFPRSNNGK